MYMENIDFIKSQQVFASQRVAIPLYHAGTVNHCPSCGHTHWHIGRSSAQCAFCHDAIPLAQSHFPSIVALQPMDAPAIA